MNISDLVGLSEPLTRLIEVVSKGVGSVFTPYLIKKTADARAHEIKTIAGALEEVGAQSGLPVVYSSGEIQVWQKPEDGTLILERASPDGRISHRLDYQERKRQRNIENVTAEAAANLANEKEVAGEKPDEDWINRFFATAQDISSEEMQMLWGRILAGEIKRPGSYSLRTLDFVRNLNKRDAGVFEKIAKLALTIPGGTAVVAVNDKEWLESNKHVYPADHFLLSELGLMYPNDLQYRAFREATTEEEAIFAHDHLIVIRRGEIKDEAPLPIWKFTDVGKELIPLIDRPLDEGYLERVGRFFVGKNGKALIGEITARMPDGLVNYRTIKQINVEQGGAANPIPLGTSAAEQPLLPGSGGG